MKNLYPKCILLWSFLVMLCKCSTALATSFTSFNEKHPVTSTNLLSKDKTKKTSLPKDKDDKNVFRVDFPKLKPKNVKLLRNVSEKVIAPDVFAFSMTSSRDTVEVGEEFELTVRVNFIDYGGSAASGVHFLPEWYKYTLRVLFPEGFVQTGGDYYDNCTKPVDQENPEAIFIIKGKFEYKNKDESEFRIIRGFALGIDKDAYILKSSYFVKVGSLKNSASSASRTNAQTVDSEYLEICANRFYIQPFRVKFKDGDRPVEEIVVKDRIGSARLTRVTNGPAVLDFIFDAPAINEKGQAVNAIITEGGDIRVDLLKSKFIEKSPPVGQSINSSINSDSSIVNKYFYPVTETDVINDTKVQRYWINASNDYYENKQCSYRGEGFILIVDYCTPPKPQITAPSTEISGNQETVTLTAKNCDFSVEWYSNLGLKVGEGLTYNASPGTYYAKCIRNCNGLKEAYSDNITINKAIQCSNSSFNPVIENRTSGGTTTFCSSGTVVLAVNGCYDNSKSRWYNTDGAIIAYGANFTTNISSNQTFVADCEDNCDPSKRLGRTTINFTVNPYDQCVSLNPQIANQTPGGVTEFCGGGQFSVKATGCPDANRIQWWFGIGTNTAADTYTATISSTSEIRFQCISPVTGQLIGPQRAMTFTVKPYSQCNYRASIVNNTPGQKTVFCSKGWIDLSVTGCPDNSRVAWYTDDVEITSGISPIIRGTITKTTRIGVNCINPYDNSQFGWNEIVFTVGNAGCNDDIPTLIIKTTHNNNYFCKQGWVNLDVDGCPDNSKAKWYKNNSFVKQGETYSEIINTTATFKVTCEIPQNSLAYSEQTFYVNNSDDCTSPSIVNLSPNIQTSFCGSGALKLIVTGCPNNNRGAYYEEHSEDGSFQYLFGKFDWELMNGVSYMVLNYTPTKSGYIKAFCFSQGNIDYSTEQRIAFKVNPVPTITTSSLPGCIGTPFSLNTNVPNSPYNTGQIKFEWKNQSGAIVGTSQNITLNATTSDPQTYTVKYTNNKGCSTTSSTTVTNLANPVVTVPSPSLSICEGGVLQLNANSNVGSGKKKIDLQLEPNTSNADRTVTLTVSGSPSPTPSTITIVQKGLGSTSCVQCQGYTFTNGQVIGYRSSDTNQKAIIKLENGCAKVWWADLNGPAHGDWIPGLQNKTVPESIMRSCLTFENINNCASVTGCDQGNLVDLNNISSKGGVVSIEINLPSLSGAWTVTKPSNVAWLSFIGTTAGSNTVSGEGKMIYDWYKNGILVKPNIQNPSISGLVASDAGTYQVKVTDTRNCSATASVNVVNNPHPVVTVTSNEASPVETGKNVTLQYTTTPSFATGTTLTHSWAYRALATGTWQTLPSSTNSNYTINSFSVNQKGLYKVDVLYDAVKQCKTSGVINLDSKPFSCALNVVATPTCYEANGARWAKLDLTLKNKTLGWKGQIIVKRIKDVNGVAVTDAPILTYRWGTTTAKDEILPVQDKILDGTYEITLQEKRSDEESGAGVECIPPKVLVVVGCQFRSCDIRIKVQDAVSGLEVSKLERISGSANYKPIKLSVINTDGTPIQNVTYKWTGPNGTISNSAAEFQTVSKVGEYSVDVIGGANTCDAYVTLSGSPCITLPNEGACGAPPSLVVTENCDNGPFLNNLAEGDKFSAADYYVEVTEITDGSPEMGWTGKGKVTYFRILDAFRISMEVEFTDAKINECYQFVCGKIITTYDPTWSNFVDWAEITGGIQKIIDVGKSILDKDPLDPQTSEDFNNFIDKAKQEVENLPFSQAEYDSLIAKLEEARSTFKDFVGCSYQEPSSQTTNTTKSKEARIVSNATVACSKDNTLNILNEIGNFKLISSITCIPTDLYKEKFANNKTFIFYSNGSLSVKLKDDIDVVAFVNNRARPEFADRIGRLYAFRSQGIVYVPCAEKQRYVQTGENCDTDKFYNPAKTLTAADFPQKVVITTATATTESGTVVVTNTTTNTQSQTFSITDGCVCKIFSDGKPYGEFGNVITDSFVGDPNNKLTDDDKKALENLFNGSKKNGVSLSHVMKLILTDELTPKDKFEYIVKFIKDNPTTYVLWLHRQNNVWVIKEESRLVPPSKNQEFENLGIAAGIQGYTLTKILNAADSILGLVSSNAPKNAKDYAERAYTFLDLVNQGVESLKITEKTWDPGNSEFNPTASRVFALLMAPITSQGFFIQKSVEYLSVNAGGTENTNLKSMLDLFGNTGVSPIFSFDSDVSRVQFAFVCGLWNGLVDIPQGLTAAVKAISGVFVSGNNNTFTKLGITYQQLKKYKRIDDDGIAASGISAALFDALSAQVSTPYKISNLVGTLVPPISVAVLSAGATAGSLGVGTLGKVISRTIRFLDKVDNIADFLTPMTHAFRFTGKGVRATYRLFTSSNEVIAEVVEKADDQILAGLTPEGNPVELKLDEVKNIASNKVSDKGSYLQIEQPTGVFYKFAKKLSSVDNLILLVTYDKTRNFLNAIKGKLSTSFTQRRLRYKGQEIFEVSADGKLKSIDNGVADSKTPMVESFTSDGKCIINGNENEGFLITNEGTVSNPKYKCSDGGGLCFPAGTLILAKSRDKSQYKKIEQIKAGDTVGGYDHNSQKLKWGVVKSTTNRIKIGIVSVFAAGALIAQPTLEHPFWSTNQQRYVAANTLHRGDTLLNAQGQYLPVDSVVIHADTAVKVYNFEVKYLHNYFVGSSEVLVHNECAKLERLNKLRGFGLSDDILINIDKQLHDFGITVSQRKVFYDALTKDGAILSNSSAKRLLNEMNGNAINEQTQKFLVNSVTEGSLEVWNASKNWGHRIEVLEYFTNKNKITNGRLDGKYFYTSTNNGIVVAQRKSDGTVVQWGTVEKNRVTAKRGAGGNMNELNQLLNIIPLLKNMEYIVDGRITYKTNSQAIVWQVEDNNLNFDNPTIRSLTEQTARPISKGYLLGDHGGHIVSREAGGPSEQINYWAMNGKVNGRGGAWRNMEEEFRRIKQADTKVKYKVVYTGRSFINGRPQYIDIELYYFDDKDIAIRIPLASKYNRISNF